jgi:hypothetical protein
VEVCLEPEDYLEDRKMADYFSKYRGRGGPAIEPGIIQMMGSIGDEYAKGIESIGDSVSSAIDERREREQAEEAVKIWKKAALGPGKVPDEKGFGKAITDAADEENFIAEQVSIAEAKVDSAVDESSEMQDRVYTEGHPLSQVRKIQKDLDTYSTVLDNRNEKIGEIETQSRVAQETIDSIHASLLPIEVKTNTLDGYSPPSYNPPRKPTESETARLKEAKEILSRNKSRLKEITKGNSYSNLVTHVEKLRNLKSLETEIPGSTVGYTKLKRNVEGGWDSEETEAGRIVAERARVFLKQKEDGVFKGGKLASQFLGFNPRYTDESLLAQGVKAEDLERFKTLPQHTLNTKVQEAREQWRDAQERLEEFRSRPMLRQEDFMRNQTNREFLSEILEKVDTGKVKPNVIPAVAAFLDKTKPPSVDVKEIAGKTLIVTDPQTTAVTTLSDSHTFANQLSLKRFQFDLAKYGDANSIGAKKYFDEQMEAVENNIHKFKIAREQGTWPGDNMRPWNEEIDGKALKDLMDKKSDIERFYIQRNEGTGSKPVVRKPIKM